MKRITGFPTRPNMVQQLLDVGFDYYNLPSSDGSHYWSDNVAYEFTLAEIDRIEDATNELHAMPLPHPLHPRGCRHGRLLPQRPQGAGWVSICLSQTMMLH